MIPNLSQCLVEAVGSTISLGSPRQPMVGRDRAGCMGWECGSSDLKRNPSGIISFCEKSSTSTTSNSSRVSNLVVILSRVRRRECESTRTSKKLPTGARIKGHVEFERISDALQCFAGITVHRNASIIPGRPLNCRRGFNCSSGDVSICYERSFHGVSGVVRVGFDLAFISARIKSRGARH